MSMMETVFQKQRKAFEKQVEEQNRGYRKPRKINIERNISYGEDRLQTFDMIFPTDAKPDIPVIINIHGGGLVMGDKDFNTRFNIKMAQNGYLVISVNYRLVPEVTVFEQMQDVIDGIEAARKHQEEERDILRAIWGVTEDEVNQINKRKAKRDYDWGVPVYLTADSAGAYLALYILAVQGSPEVAREFNVRPMTTRITAAAFISGMFYTTNTESTITLSDVDITYADDNDFFLKCTGNSNQRGWGESGNNGADCLFTATKQEMQGNVVWDSISQLDFYMTDGSTLTGAVTDDESNAGEGGDGYCNLYIGEDCTWTVTGDSTLTSLSNSGTIVDADGNTVTVKGTDGTVYVEGESSYTVTVDSYSDNTDLSGASSTTQWSDYEVEMPEELA